MNRDKTIDEQKQYYVKEYQKYQRKGMYHESQEALFELEALEKLEEETL